MTWAPQIVATWNNVCIEKRILVEHAAPGAPRGPLGAPLEPLRDTPGDALGAVPRALASHPGGRCVQKAKQ